MHVGADVVGVLARSTCDGDRLVLPFQLDRKLYERTARAIEAAGGKWNRKAKVHIFDGEAAELIEPILLDGEISDARREFDFFETPRAIIERMIDEADIPISTSKDPRDWPRILEPSAGSGRIIHAIHKRSWDRPLNVFACEIQPTLAEKVSALLYPEGRCNPADFLTWVPADPPVFDRVIMNPPFSKRQDARHVLHAIRFVKPGGRVVAIMSAGVTFRQDTMYAECRDRATKIEPLPPGSFQESGTMVNAVLATFDVAA